MNSLADYVGSLSPEQRESLRSARDAEKLKTIKSQRNEALDNTASLVSEVAMLNGVVRLLLQEKVMLETKLDNMAACLRESSAAQRKAEAALDVAQAAAASTAADVKSRARKKRNDGAPTTGEK